MKFLSYLFVAIISFSLALYLVDYKLENVGAYDFSSENPIPAHEESTEFTTYYNQLSDFEKSLYNISLEAVKIADSEVKIKNIDVSAFQKSLLTVGKALQYDHPEYFWFTGGFSYTYTEFSDVGTVKLKPIYYSYVSSFFKTEDKLKELQNEVTRVAELAKQYSSDDYERILFVHDYLIKNAIYDHDALDEYYKADKSPSCEYIFAAYGCLLNGKTVCSGFAKAFQLIMYELGFDCTYVVGDAGEAHGWNCIYLDGEGYFIDVTWDNADFEKGEVPLYNYAFITSEMLEETHSITMPFEKPVCTETKYNFFHKKGYYSEKYDKNELKAILEMQKDANAAYVRFGSRSALGDAVNNISTSSAYKKYDGMDKVYKITYNEKLHTLTFLKEQE